MGDYEEPVFIFLGAPNAFPSWFDFFDNFKLVLVSVQVMNKFHLVVVLSRCYEMHVMGQ